MNAKPVLSIGMIFKNEIRCLERCLKSLQPLREAVPCELVIADTGSTDGSEQIAAQYADDYFRFPWIDDFSAARNAVMDRCSGVWYLSLDADEWFDENIGELVQFLRDRRQWKDYEGCALTIRNYMHSIGQGDISDFLAVRILRMSTGIRFEGAIHEHWKGEGVHNVYGLSEMMLHHDGYVEFSAEQGEAKRERNMALLRKELERDPDNLMTLLQSLESSVDEEMIDYTRRAVRGVLERRHKWDKVGPPIMRYAASIAKSEKLPELWTWIQQGRELFPDSMIIRLDVSYIAFVDCFDTHNWTQAITEGEAYLQALADYKAWKFDHQELMFGTLTNLAPVRENIIRICLSNAYLEERQGEKAWAALKQVDLDSLVLENVRNYVGMLMNIQAQTECDTGEAMTKVWETLKEKPDFQLELVAAAAECLPKSFRVQEEAQGFRHAYMCLAVLADRCDLGRAARVISLESTGDIKAVLNQVEDWKQFSIHALIHALECGVTFPLPEKPLTLEEMDALADRIARAGNEILEFNAQFGGVSFGENAQLLCWARALSMVVLQVFPWKNAGVENTERGLQAVRVFAHVERAFLHACYAESALTEARLFLLPPMHRFGWHVVQAFDALAAGDRMGYVRCLRNSLTANGDMGSLVEFLTENTPELQPSRPSAELQLLADQVRSLLMLYPEGDPMLEALKSSEAYQRVAHLIEGTAPAIWGSLAQ